MGEFENAVKCFQTAIEIHPNYSSAHNNLGLTFKELGEFEKAVKCFQTAIEIQPNYSTAHNNLGVTFKALGEFKKAIKIYKNVKIWCKENCKKEYILDDTVYAFGVKVSFEKKAEANKFEKVFNP